MDKILFSDRLVALRKARGYSTQYELARAYDDMFPPKRRDEAGGNDGNCGGILGTIKNYENGNNESSPKLEKVCNLCKLLGCDVSYLVGDYKELDYATHKIAEYTGLSENAITRLHDMRKYNQMTWYSDILSAVIEHPEFCSLLSYMLLLIKAGEKESPVLNSDHPENVKLRDVYQTRITNLLYEVVVGVAPVFEERPDYKHLYKEYLLRYRNKDNNGNYRPLSEIQEEMEKNGLEFDPVLFEGERDNG